MVYRTLYDNGLPFSSILAENLDDIKLRVVKNKAACIIIDGGLGEGKTTLAVHCSDYLCGCQIDLSKQYGYGGIQFQERLHMCYEDKLITVIYDEGGDFAKRGSLTDFNKQLNRVFETFRAFKVIVILCLPSVGAIDNQLFMNQVPRLLLHCEGRSDDYGDFKGYSLDGMYWLKYWMDKIVVKPEAYKRVFPNFQGHFLNLPAARCAELDKLCTKHKEKELVKTMIHAQGLMSVGQIAAALNRSVPWVRLKMRQKRVRHAKLFKNRYYYDKDCMGVLVS